MFCFYNFEQDFHFYKNKSQQLPYVSWVFLAFYCRKTLYVSSTVYMLCKLDIYCMWNEIINRGPRGRKANRRRNVARSIFDWKIISTLSLQSFESGRRCSWVRIKKFNRTANSRSSSFSFRFQPTLSPFLSIQRNAQFQRHSSFGRCRTLRPCFSPESNQRPTATTKWIHYIQRT